LSNPIQAHSRQRRARHKRRYDSAILVSSRSHEETLNPSIESNDFTVTFDSRLENPGLVALQTLFVREHKRLCTNIGSLISRTRRRCCCEIKERPPSR